MTRYVIGPDVAVRLARDRAVIRGEHQILAPVLLRSQVLSVLYQAVRRGELTRRMPSDSSATCTGCGSGCWTTLSCTTWHGRPLACSGGLTLLTPSMWP